MIIKHKIIYLLLLLIIGFAGYYIGQSNNQRINTIIKPVKKIVYIQSNTINKPKEVIANNQSKSASTKTLAKIQNKAYQQLQQQNLFLPEFLPNQQTFNKIIDNLALPQLEDYLNKLISRDDTDFQQIYDKHTFAKKLIHAFLDGDNNQDIKTYSNIDFSLSEKLNADKDKDINFKISDSNQTIYAHLQLDENSDMLSNTFIKWMHIDSGRVLLFKKKDINPITRQNWVSFTPNENWNTGNYQVTFYQFNSELKPIVYGNYYIE